MHCNDAVETLHRIELGQHEAINKTAVSLSLPSAPVSGTKKMTLGWFRNEQVLACSSCPGARHGHQARGWDVIIAFMHLHFRGELQEGKMDCFASDKLCSESSFSSLFLTEYVCC